MQLEVVQAMSVMGQEYSSMCNLERKAVGMPQAWRKRAGKEWDSKEAMETQCRQEAAGFKGTSDFSVFLPTVPAFVVRGAATVVLCPLERGGHSGRGVCVCVCVCVCLSQGDF